MPELQELRNRIDELDRNLVAMLNERAKVVIEIGKLKRRDKGAGPVYAPDRESAVFAKIKAANAGPLPNRCLQAVYRELMSASFLLERPLRIAYLGPKGSFSHNAAMLKFGQSVEYEPQSDIRGIFEEISREHCDLGIVPVENTINGGIVDTLDSLVSADVAICAEMRMAVHHNLLANCKIEDIKKVYSRPEVFAQCRNWLASTLPGVEQVPTASTGVAVQMVAEHMVADDEIESQTGGVAAIGSSLAGDLYGVPILCERIEDANNNITRFFVIGRESARRSGHDKTTMVFSTADKTGALVDVLQVFRNNKINLTNIESRPNPVRTGEYYFFVDCQGYQTDENVQRAVEQAREYCLRLIILGSYPQAFDVL